MTDPQAGSEPDALQFDRAVPANAPDKPAGTVVCQMCGKPIAGQYYQVNSAVLCEQCKDTVVASAVTPRGQGVFTRAAVFGIGGAILGAAIYFVVAVVTGLEIGIIAVAAGYLVGRGVRKGAGGGGRRFQILALVLTYLSVGLAYTALAMRHVPPTSFAFLVIAGLMSTVTAPLSAVLESGGSGVLSAIIIGVGLLQAWQMTRAPQIVVTGPFSIGSAAGSSANGA